MGYESKIYICRVYDFGDGSRHFINEAMLDLSKMGYEEVNGRTFPQIFRTPMNAPLWVDGEKQTEDCYGAELCYAEIPTVLDWLYHSKTAQEYWKATVAINVLNAFWPYVREGDDKSTAPNFVVVHYGY